ncbi:MAG: hypothetical protein QMC81_01985 [Thermoanaerobacterales bacterium]|nr:hypothetical protein [Bacillota bacterium]MDI6906244.1 hypothetical protein [Thermoanaerobacterales bacterium]
MGRPVSLSEEQMRHLTDDIAVICLSEGFLRLREELETIYASACQSNVSRTAFSDALFAFLAEKVGVKT